MVNHGWKPGQARVLLRVLAVVLTGLLWGSHASATVACKNSSQKNTKACAHAVQKKTATKSKPQSKSSAHCPSTKNPAARRRCLAAIAPVHKAALVPTSTPALIATTTPAAVTGPATPCFSALAASQASQNMAAKVPFFVGQAPGPALLANPDHPSKKEQAELSSLIAGYQMCQDMSAPGPAGSEAGEQPRLEDEHWRASKAVLDSLRAGKLSFGAAARALVEAEQRSTERN